MSPSLLLIKCSFWHGANSASLSLMRRWLMSLLRCTRGSCCSCLWCHCCCPCRCIGDGDVKDVTVTIVYTAIDAFAEESLPQSGLTVAVAGCSGGSYCIRSIYMLPPPPHIGSCCGIKRTLNGAYCYPCCRCCPCPCCCCYPCCFCCCPCCCCYCYCPMLLLIVSWCRAIMSTVISN